MKNLSNIKKKHNPKHSIFSFGWKLRFLEIQFLKRKNHKKKIYKTVNKQDFQFNISDKQCLK